jgi:hypothetical protein
MAIFINGNRVNNIKSNGNISIINGKVIVDGQTLELDDSPVFNITIEGNVDKIDGEFASVEVTGDAGTVSTMSGDVTVKGGVNGSVSTMSGDVNAKGGVGGSVSTMSGDIRR